MGNKTKFKKGAKVIVIAGKDKGRTGIIKKILIDENKAIVSGVNIATKSVKPTGSTLGRMTKVEQPIDLSNIAYVEDGKPVKVMFEGKGKDKKVVSRKTKKKLG